MPGWESEIWHSKTNKQNPKPYLYIEMWAFFLSQNISSSFEKQARFFLIDQDFS